MQIEVAKYSGACYGVNRALELVLDAAKDCDRVYTMGPLIHNPIVVEELKSQGIIPASSLDEVQSGTLVIRTHGVPLSVIDEAHEKGLEVLNATCPHVMKAQNTARKLAQDGYFVIIVGEEGHPEVEGLRSYAGEHSIVVGSVSDFDTNVTFEHAGIVVQTTQSLTTLEEIVGFLEPRTKDLKVCNTICYATTQRQTSATELAQSADVMIIIGGRNSANTRRLFELCSHECKHVYHIEARDELKEDWFQGSTCVGITAGASTPESHVEAVRSAIETITANIAQKEE